MGLPKSEWTQCTGNGRNVGTVFAWANIVTERHCCDITTTFMTLNVWAYEAAHWLFRDKNEKRRVNTQTNFWLRYIISLAKL